MSYSALSALGNVYSIPTTNNSSVIPNMTVSANVPIQQMTHDAFVGVWPEAAQRVMELAPWLVSAAMPGIKQEAPAIVDAAWPRVMQRMPEAISAAQPFVAGMVQQMVPVVWESLKPQMMAEISTIITKEETKAAVVGGVMAAGALVGGLYFAKRMGWLSGLGVRK